MVRKYLVAASIALVAGGLARPASADAKYLELYGNIFGAAPLGYSRGGDDDKGAARQFLFSPFVRDSDFDFRLGAGLAVVNAGSRPWALNVNWANIDLDGAADSFTQWDVNGRLVLLGGTGGRRPLVSLVGRYQHVASFGDRYDALLAADQRISDSLFLTGNIGWASTNFGADDEDMIGGVGATWSPSGWPKLTISADYVFDNDIDGDDSWSVSGLWRINEISLIRVGGGKSGTVFGNYIARVKWLE